MPVASSPSSLSSALNLGSTPSVVNSPLANVLIKALEFAGLNKAGGGLQAMMPGMTSQGAKAYKIIEDYYKSPAGQRFLRKIGNDTTNLFESMSDISKMEMQTALENYPSKPTTYLDKPSGLVLGKHPSVNAAEAYLSRVHRGFNLTPEQEKDIADWFIRHLGE